MTDQDTLTAWVTQLREARAAGDETAVETLLRTAVEDEQLSQAVMDLGLKNAWASGDVDRVRAWFDYQERYGN